MSKKYVWKVNGTDYRNAKVEHYGKSVFLNGTPLPELWIEADSSDEALAIARRQNRYYNSTQVLKEVTQ